MAQSIISTVNMQKELLQGYSEGTPEIYMPVSSSGKRLAY